MSKIVCPSCKKSLLKEVSRCPECGFALLPFEYTCRGFTTVLSSTLDKDVARADIPKTFGGAPVVAITESACEGLAKLALLGLPDGLLRVEKAAFKDCVALPSLIIPSSVREIGDEAFSGCTSLVSVTLGTATSSLGGNRICFCGNLAASRYAGGLALLDGAPLMCTCGALNYQNALTRIGARAFYRCPIATLTVPEGVQRVEKEAFKGCGNLESVSLPSSLSYVDDAFADCPKLKSIKFAGNSIQFRKIEGYKTFRVMVHCIDATINPGKKD